MFTESSSLTFCDMLLTNWLFLGNFGGLLGLCLGFSLVNVVEIIYFATVGLYQNFSWLTSSGHNRPNALIYRKSQSFEDREVREMYANDFKNHNRKMFQNRL